MKLTKEIGKEQQLEEVIQVLNELQEDTTLPRNVKLKLESVLRHLQGPDEVSIKVNRCLDELEEVVNDVNMQPYTRTQLWNIVTMLEKL